MSTYTAVLFDLLSALLDSPSLWARAAADASVGHRWRQLAARRMQASHRYEPYERVVAQAAEGCGLKPLHVQRLIDSWDTLVPWADVAAALASVPVPFGVVTNCSEALARLAVAKLGRQPDVVVSAERADVYKPSPAPYLLALRELEVEAQETLYVAGSRYDVEGALGVGMPVFWIRRQPDAPISGPTYVRESLRRLPSILGAR
jgi:Haloacid dehalogenase superfamily, subfamily IA, variant 2 with 3rd motif like haloacid dehalogenase